MPWTLFTNVVTAWNWGAKAGLFYAGTNLLCNIWCWFRLPETKDRTFGEIDLLFDNKVHARKFKYTKVDRECLPLFANVVTVLMSDITEFTHQNMYAAKLGDEKAESAHVEETV